MNDSEKVRTLVVDAVATAADYIEKAEPVVRVATNADVTMSTETDALPLVAAQPREVAELAQRYGVSSSIRRLQKSLDDLPG